MFLHSKYASNMSQSKNNVATDRSSVPSNDDDGATGADGMSPSDCAEPETSLGAASEQNANKASVHRDEDGNVIAISIVLSPMQIALHGLPDGVDTVCPVVSGANSITLVPADYTR